MKKEVILVILLLAISISAQNPEETQETFNPGVLPDSPIYFADKAIDNLRVNLAPEEGKALVAIEVHNERIAEAEELVETEEIEPQYIEEAISEAEKNIKIVQEEIIPEVNEEVKDSTKISVEVLTDIKEKVPEEALARIENAINRQIVEEKKTEITAEITSKVNQLCTELIELVGLEKAIEQEPRCNPDFENSPKWLKRKVSTDYKDFDDAAKQKFFEEMSICFNDPRECRCNEIPIKSFSNTCHKIIPNVIKCQFEQDEQACSTVEEISKNTQEMFEELPVDLRIELEEFFRSKEEEAFENFAPRECVEAGATTKEACMQIMINKYMPQECKDAGATTREACEEIMIEKYGSGAFGQVPSECSQDGKFIGAEECQRIMLEKYLPAECKDAGAFTRESCEAIMISKYAPPECIKDGSFIGREACEELMRSKFETQQQFVIEQQRGFDIGQAIGLCIQQGRSREECEALVRGQIGQVQPSTQPLERAEQVISSLENNPEVQRVSENFKRIENNLQSIPSECAGLTKEECISKTGKTFVEEIPTGVVFKDGQAEPITKTHIENAIKISETSIEEINVEQVRESINYELSTLETATRVLDQAGHEEAASAIESVAQESPPSEGETPAGSAVLDVLKLMQKLRK